MRSNYRALCARTLCLLSLSAWGCSGSGDATEQETPISDASAIDADASLLDTTQADTEASVPDAVGPTDDPLGLLCAQALLAIPADAWHAEGRVNPDREKEVLAATRACLSAYLKLETINPPTDKTPGEIAAVRFFETVFRKLNLPTQTAPLARKPDPKRLSIVATRKGTSVDTSVVLLSHTDVVRAEGTWKHGAFSGDDDGTYVWGRGALDMKGVGISQLVAMAILHRAGVTTRRDVHFLAVADEEVGGLGAEYVATTQIIDDSHVEKEDPLGLRPGVVLNEGGDGVRDALISGHDFFVIGAEEKGCVWTQFAHNDATRLVVAFAKSGIIDKPDASNYADQNTRQSLSKACHLTGFLSDKEQKTNVQPRQATLDLMCDSGSETLVKAAVAMIGTGSDPAPSVTVSSAASGGKEAIHIEIAGAAGGHGAAGTSLNALHFATRALISTGQVDPNELATNSQVKDQFFKYSLSPANKSLVSQLARAWGETTAGAAEWIATQPAMADALLKVGHTQLPTDSPFRTTCSWTHVIFPVDGEARAKLDCRTNFDASDGAAFEGALAGYMKGFGASLRTNSSVCYDCYHQNFSESPFGDQAPAYETIRYLVERSSPDVIAAPYLFPASSDSYFFRRLKVPSYGIWPAVLTQEELETMHAVDERAPISSVYSAVRIYAETIERLANDTPLPVADEVHQLKQDTLSCASREGAGWQPQKEDAITCDGVTSTTWHCKVADQAPRFLRVRPSKNDARLFEITRLMPGYSEGTELFPAGSVDREIYKSRESGADPSTRVFEGQEFEIDTGSGTNRNFMLRCSTPKAQFVASGFTYTRLSFYR